uniref:Uncharacterized protein n=1 Tax=Anguilla anguilla TaxID=7936 RepID=A0A0E9WVT6_ANGAN
MNVQMSSSDQSVAYQLHRRFFVFAVICHLKTLKAGGTSASPVNEICSGLCGISGNLVCVCSGC